MHACGWSDQEEECRRVHNQHICVGMMIASLELHDKCHIPVVVEMFQIWNISRGGANKPREVEMFQTES